MVYVDELPPIPDFLDRSKWTQDQWDKWKKSRKAIEDRSKRAAQYERQQAERRIEALKREKQEREDRKAAARQLKLDRKHRRQQQQADRAVVINCIERGHVTLGQMVKASQLSSKRLTRAIRWLLKHNRISKASKRTYKL